MYWCLFNFLLHSAPKFSPKSKWAATHLKQQLPSPKIQCISELAWSGQALRTCGGRGTRSPDIKSSNLGSSDCIISVGSILFLKLQPSPPITSFWSIGQVWHLWQPSMTPYKVLKKNSPCGSKEKWHRTLLCTLPQGSQKSNLAYRVSLLSLLGWEQWNLCRFESKFDDSSFLYDIRISKK